MSKPMPFALSNFIVGLVCIFSLLSHVSCGGTKSSSSSGPPSLSISTSSLSPGQIGAAYSATLTATGGTPPYTWSIPSGQLPPGLTLAATSGAIAGTPSQAMSSAFTVQVADSASPNSSTTKSLVLDVTRASVDQYGGRLDISCTNTTEVFTLAKVNNHWWFCTPDGHVFISMDVTFNFNSSPICAYTSTPPPACPSTGNPNLYPIYATKYAATGDSTGTGTNWAWQTLKRATSWGFNASGLETSSGSIYPWATCFGCVWPGGTQPIPIPTIISTHPTIDASVNRYGYLTEPIKDGMNTAPPAWTSAQGIGNDLYDIFDAKESTQLNSDFSNLSNTVQQKIVHNNAWILGYVSDDTDWFAGFASGPDFVNQGTGSNLGWLAVITSPVQTFIQSTRFLNESFLYSDHVYHTKADATNPASCVLAVNPCSLRDYLWQKYSGSISALNTAWGSNYTTFDSSGTQVTGESVGTGNGSTTTFTHTLAHTPVSPFTIAISVAGTTTIGDQPWFRYSGTANTGKLLSPTASYVTASTIHYSTGEISLTFVRAPANGAAITINYIYAGWMAGGTGLMDESGSGSWVGTNSYCLEGADPNYPTYFACTGVGVQSHPVPNANANFGADIDNWIAHYMAKYCKNFHDVLRGLGSNILYFGIDSLGGYGGPAYSKLLEGEAPYVDAIDTTLYWFTPTTSFSAPAMSPEFPSAYQYLTRYAGDKPLLDFVSIPAQSASSESLNPAQGIFLEQPTQSQRGLMRYNTINYLLTTPGFNGDTQFVEFNQWAWQDFQAENWGLVSLSDNAYDGVEDVTGSVACDATYVVDMGAMCGGEAANYGDVITQIRAANLLWLLQP